MRINAILKTVDLPKKEKKMFWIKIWMDLVIFYFIMSKQKEQHIIIF